MSCVLVQHHVKMIMITDASDLKTRGIRFLPDISKLHHFNTVLHCRDHKASSTVTSQLYRTVAPVGWGSTASWYLARPVSKQEQLLRILSQVHIVSIITVA